MAATTQYIWETPCIGGDIRLCRSLAGDVMRQYGLQKTLGECAPIIRSYVGIRIKIDLDVAILDHRVMSLLKSVNQIDDMMKKRRGF